MTLRFSSREQRVFATLFLSALVPACGSTTIEHDVVMRGVTVVDVETGALTEDRTIAIDDSLIVFVGEDAGNSHQGRIEIDGAGRYAIPGLWDIHVHIEGADLVEDNLLLFPVYLAYGVTTVRDMASDLGEQVLAWRDEINRGDLLGPRIYTAGRKIEGVNSMWKDDLEVADEAEMRVMMDRLDAYRVDFVKVTDNTLSADLFLATVREARTRGYRVSGHVPYGSSVEKLVTAGISTIEHASYMIRLGAEREAEIAASVRRGELTRGDAQAQYNASFVQEQAISGYEMLADRGVYVTPTLIQGQLSAYLDETDHSQDEFQRYLTEAFMAPYGPRATRILNSSPAQRRTRRENFHRILDQVPAMHAAGVQLLGGSDSAPIAAFVYPGLALHQELQLFQQAGLSPLSALQTVTLNGAEFVGERDAVGTLDVGMLASIVLLRENPLEDIAATLSIEVVVSRGDVFDRQTLDRMLDQAATQASALDTARRDLQGR